MAATVGAQYSWELFPAGDQIIATPFNQGAMRRAMTAATAGLPFDDGPRDLGPGDFPYGKHSTGILPSHVLKRLIRARREVLATDEIADEQIQPASLDLRLGPV